jgi:hypothetical protein
LAIVQLCSVGPAQVIGEHLPASIWKPGSQETTARAPHALQTPPWQVRVCLPVPFVIAQLCSDR